MRYVECYKCGNHRPIDRVKTRTIEVESGRSGGSFTYKGWGSSGGWTGSDKKFRKVGGGLNYNAGRKYYRNVKVYVCYACLKNEQLARAEAARKSKIFWSAVGWCVLLIGVYLWVQQ